MKDKKLMDYRTRNRFDKVLKAVAIGEGIEYTITTNVSEDFAKLTESEKDSLIKDWIHSHQDGIDSITWELRITL